MKLNKSTPVIKTLFAVFMILSAFAFFAGSKVYADKPPIPIGCPGTIIQGPPSQANLQVCASIPIGCPGTTQQGPPAPGFDINTCPYGVAGTSGTGSGSSGSSGSGSSTGAGGSDSARLSSCDDANKCDFVKKFINPVIKFLSAGVGLIVIIMIIVGGIQYSAAGGDAQKVVAARRRVSNALLALIVYIFMFAILNWLIPGGLV